MFTFILRRLGASVLTLVTVCVVGFFLLHAGGQDVARRIVGDTASAEIVARKERELGLDRPLLFQFFAWVEHAITGDLGRSLFSGQEVTAALASRLPVTLSLTIGAILATGVIGVLLGVIAAARGGALDRLVQTASVFASAIPGFIVALVLALVFGIWLRWLPATGYIRPEDSVTGWLTTICLPVAALSIGTIAGIAQQVRGSMLDTLRLDYVRTLRAHGIPASHVLFRHVLRNAAGPGLSLLGILFVVVFGGAVVVEQVFSLPGLGQTAAAATVGGDIPMVMGLLVVTAILVQLVTLIIDLLQGWLNPKVRLT